MVQLSALPEVTVKHVITSYSIHYTKLYDAVSKLGWVLVVLAGGLFYWITKGKTDNLTSVSQIILGVGGIGFLAAIFYNSPGKNPFVNFGVGLWETYGIVTGFLGDILSYIRLFALALSGAILGNVVITSYSIHYTKLYEVGLSLLQRKHQKSQHLHQPLVSVQP